MARKRRKREKIKNITKTKEKTMDISERKGELQTYIQERSKKVK